MTLSSRQASPLPFGPLSAPSPLRFMYWKLLPAWPRHSQSQTAGASRATVPPLSVARGGRAKAWALMKLVVWS
ncbi:MAG: hypothetical protein A2004_13785 [Spirochaetes bacterium GWC1_61_12]|nr:MAG: hypothetical protein A2004_13785 [Spirochaetes bacterium GWC1_61_12]